MGVLEGVRGAAEQGALGRYAFHTLGSALCVADHDEDALSVAETQLSMLQRACERPRRKNTHVKGAIAASYAGLKRHEEALGLRRESTPERWHLDFRPIVS